MVRVTETWLSNRLRGASQPTLALYAVTAAFLTYFCMYAFRKPFTAAEFAGESLLGTGVDLKTALITGQILGYTISKYVGIRFCSELSSHRRAVALVGLVLLAEVALLAVAVLPGVWCVVAMFVNGFPLGMVWGLVVRYLEGRRVSELLLAGLSCSYIVASAVVRDVGRALIDHMGLSEVLMPATVGLIFLPAYLLSVWMLEQLPPPSAEDIAERVARPPMDRAARWTFLRRFLPGLLLLLVVYIVLTAYRDFRDNYGIEIFGSLGYADVPAIFSRTELPVALGVMGVMAALNLVRDNHRGLLAVFLTMISGLTLLGASTLALDYGWLDGGWWMLLIGLGAYLCYVPFGSILFDRMMASTRTVGTAVFAIYVADAVGYTGSIVMQLQKDLLHAEISRLDFFRQVSYVLALGGVALLALACAYFLHKSKSADAAS